MVVLPSFGCALVTRMDLLRSSAGFSRNPARSVLYASRSCGFPTSISANAVSRTPSFKFCFKPVAVLLLGFPAGMVADYDQLPVPSPALWWTTGARWSASHRDSTEGFAPEPRNAPRASRGPARRPGAWQSAQFVSNTLGICLAVYWRARAALKQAWVGPGGTGLPQSGPAVRRPRLESQRTSDTMPERDGDPYVRSSQAGNPTLPYHRNRDHDLPRPRHPKQDRRNGARGRLPASPDQNRDARSAATRRHTIRIRRGRAPAAR
jgi:hypothetical protein